MKQRTERLLNQLSECAETLVMYLESACPKMLNRMEQDGTIKAFLEKEDEDLFNLLADNLTPLGIAGARELVMQEIQERYPPEN